MSDTPTRHLPHQQGQHASDEWWTRKQATRPIYRGPGYSAPLSIVQELQLEADRHVEHTLMDAETGVIDQDIADLLAKNHRAQPTLATIYFIVLGVLILEGISVAVLTAVLVAVLAK